MVNKKTVILLAMLVLFTWVASNRWDIKVYDNGSVRYMTDKLSTQTKALLPNKEGKKGYREIVLSNRYLLHGATAVLYIAIGATVIALIREARRKDEP